MTYWLALITITGCGIAIAEASHQWQMYQLRRDYPALMAKSRRREG